MNSIIEIFQKLLQKYRFLSPVLPAQQKAIIGRRRDGLGKILKAVNQFNFIYMQAVSVNILARKAGIRITMMQSKIVAGLLLIIFTSVASYGSIQIVNTINNKIIDEPGTDLKKDRGKISGKIEIPGRKIPSMPEKIAEHGNRYLVGIGAFEGNEKQTVNAVTDGVLGALQRLNGEEKILDIRKRKKGSARLVIMGSIKEIGGKFFIIADLIDLEKSAIIYSSSKKYNNEDDIASACEGIAAEITEKIR